MPENKNSEVTHVPRTNYSVAQFTSIHEENLYIIYFPI